MVKYYGPENKNFQLLLERQGYCRKSIIISGTHHRELKILSMAGDFKAPGFQMWSVVSHFKRAYVCHLFRLYFLSPIHFLVSFFLLPNEWWVWMKQFFLPFKNKQCDLFKVENNIYVTATYREVRKCRLTPLSQFRTIWCNLAPCQSWPWVWAARPWVGGRRGCRACWCSQSPADK